MKFLILNLLIFFILVFAIKVVQNRNPIYSLLNLIFVFILTSIFFLSKNIEFLGFLLIVVYVGALAVLFLFVIMMLNLKHVSQEFNKNILLNSFLYALLLTVIAFLLNYHILVCKIGNVALIWDFKLNITNIYNSNIDIFQFIFTEYFFAFFIITIILLIALICSILLALQI
jgi:NADH-quinone oxidoreductase subunit J